MVTWTASELVGSGDIFASFFEMKWFVGLLLGTVIVLAFTMIGGFRAVIITDVIQFVILSVIGVTVSLVALSKAGGFAGLAAHAEAVGEPERMNLFSHFRSNISFILSFTIAWIIEADIWQRFFAAKSVKHAQKGAIVATVIFIPLYLIFTFGGMAAAVLLPDIEGSTFANVVKLISGTFMSAVAFTGVAAAVMSSASTSMNTGALTFTEDIYHNHINKDASQKQLVKVGWITTFIVALLAFVIAWAGQNMLYVLWLAADILAAGAFIPVILGLFWKRGTTRGALFSMVGGTIFTLVQFLYGLGVLPFPIIPEHWPLGAYPYYNIWSLGIALVLYLIGTYTTKPGIHVDNFYEKVEAGIKD